MTRDRRTFGAGVLLIFGAYYYFLIFAQFAFLNLLQRTHPAEGDLRLVMGAMAMGGLAGSILIPLLPVSVRRTTLLRFGFLGCASTLAVNWVPPSAFLEMAFVIGISLGVVTVTLASSLRSIFTNANWGMGAALGTGLAYSAANVPWIFQAQPQIQALTAALVALACALLVPKFESPDAAQGRAPAKWPVLFGTLFFGILVWLDSAAFYIIQHSDLKLGTWSDSVLLWRNAAVHLSAALIAGALVRRAGFILLLAASFGLLGVSALSANQPETRALTGSLYPAGVSLYSICLVAFPAFGASTTQPRSITWIASLLYAFSGWICSGLGIGMAQDLQRVPWQFVIAAALLLLAPAVIHWIGKGRHEVGYAALVCGVALCCSLRSWSARDSDSLIAQGRNVYISEGCINCHSQYVKPGSRDEMLWGPSQPVEQFTADGPPLFGNRRQGPDLMNIGDRRSADWLRVHFLSPRSLAPGSSMPSYEYLFSDGRGGALIAYLLSLRSEKPGGNAIQGWSLAPDFAAFSNARELFQQHCSMCHAPANENQKTLAQQFRKPPPNLASGPFAFAPSTLPLEVRQKQLARIIKFGLPGTDMPGHEYLRDADVFALVRWVEQYSQNQ